MTNRVTRFRLADICVVLATALTLAAAPSFGVSQWFRSTPAQPHTAPCGKCAGGLIDRNLSLATNFFGRWPVGAQIKIIMIFQYFELCF